MKCSKQIVNRVKRAQGQLQGVVNMMEQQRSCDDIATQLSAVRASIDKTLALITAQNLLNTIETVHDIELKDVDDALNLLIRSR